MLHQGAIEGIAGRARGAFRHLVEDGFKALDACDVGIQPDHPISLATGMTDHRSPRQYPARTAVPMQHAILLFIGLASALEVGLDGGFHRRPIVSMDALPPPLPTIGQVAVGEPEHALPAWRKQHFATRQIPFPQAVAAATQGERITLLAQPQRGLDLPAPLLDRALVPPLPGGRIGERFDSELDGLDFIARRRIGIDEIT